MESDSNSPPFRPPEPSAEALPTGDVQAPDDAEASAVYRPSIPVLSTEEDRNEVMVRVRGSTLKRIRSHLTALKTQSVDWSDFFLALFTLGAGSWVTSLVSTPASSTGSFVFEVAPIITVGALVAFLFQRRNERVKASDIAKRSLHELPDPDDFSIGEEK